MLSKISKFENNENTDVTKQLELVLKAVENASEEIKNDFDI